MEPTEVALPTDNTVYIVRRSDTRQVVYVGITRGSLRDRLASHKTKGTPVGNFAASGVLVTIESVESGLTRGQAIDAEARMIIGIGVDNLLNVAEIGTGSKAAGSSYSARRNQEGKRFPGMRRRAKIEWPEPILAEMPTVPDHELAAKYGINENTIRTKRLRLGIKKSSAKRPTVWTPKMDSRLATATDVQVGKDLGVGTMSVRNRRQVLGVSAYVAPEHHVRCQRCGSEVKRSRRPCGARMSIQEHRARKYCSQACTHS